MTGEMELTSIVDMNAIIVQVFRSEFKIVISDVFVVKFLG